MSNPGRGDVIATRGRAAGVVWQVRAGEVAYVPISSGRIPRHRAEIALDAIGDVIACGIAMPEAVIRCQLLHHGRADRLTVVGRAPAPLLARIIAAVGRETETRGMEDRLHFMSRAGLPAAALA